MRVASLSISMTLVKMIYVILLHTLCSSMLILEDLCEDTLSLSIIDVHASSMDSIELILDVSTSSWGSLATSSSRIVATLSDGWPCHFKNGAVTSYQVLSLV